MTNQKLKQFKKLTAINKIRKIYSSNEQLDSFGDESYAEQREWLVSQIIIELEADLDKIKNS